MLTCTNIPWIFYFVTKHPVYVTIFLSELILSKSFVFTLSPVKFVTKRLKLDDSGNETNIYPATSWTSKMERYREKQEFNPDDLWRKTSSILRGAVEPPNLESNDSQTDSKTTSFSAGFNLPRHFRVCSEHRPIGRRTLNKSRQMDWSAEALYSSTIQAPQRTMALVPRKRNTGPDERCLHSQLMASAVTYCCRLRLSLSLSLSRYPFEHLNPPPVDANPGVHVFFPGQ